MKNKTKGFTLIELLVVIAIIGILSSVVLSSLGQTRSKASDTSVRSTLVSARSEALLYFENGDSFNGVCDTSGTNTIGSLITSAAAVVGGTYSVSDSANASATVAVCHDDSAGWAAVVPLKAQAGFGWCVDSLGTGTTTAITVLDTDDDITCL